MNDMKSTIVPDSSQINADELQAGPITVRIAGVKIKGGKEQPVDILIDGMEKVYRPCKGMCRILVAAWGADSSKYIGRSLTLYCDPKVRWGGLEVGGIRISHMSDISESMTMALTVTRANKKPFTVKPLADQRAAGASPSATSGINPGATVERAGSPSQRPAATQGPDLPVKDASKPDEGRTTPAIAAALPQCDPALLIKAREWAEAGTNRYSSWWNGLTPTERKAVGTVRHEEFKKIAEQVPA